MEEGVKFYNHFALASAFAKEMEKLGIHLALRENKGNRKSLRELFRSYGKTIPCYLEENQDG